ncbi:MAG: ImmA/IrrE family metallo-endopeptidase [Verrucomicrobiales bacterium]|nr:ImmA/IrrE family metallo-endopeptidase [Verrucomicrobiales bacterium]
MEHVWKKVEELRNQYDLLKADRTPIDVFTFFEVDLRLDAIEFPSLTAKYRVEAAVKADFSGIYVDQEQYKLMERGPDWKLARLRFTVAHELAHYFLHRDVPQAEHFASLPDFARWNEDYGGRKYTLEQEANEFAGRLLVPEPRLRACYDSFSQKMWEILPSFTQSEQVRHKFAETICRRFGVNADVIVIRLDRDGIWSSA